MNRIAMTAAAAGLLRALIARAAVPRNRILLTDARSTDWQSLTLIGERHRIELRVTGPDAPAAAGRMCGGLEDAEFHIPRQIVADIAVAEQPRCASDGSISIAIEALTVEE
jgi:hypothetical protein